MYIYIYMYVYVYVYVYVYACMNVYRTIYINLAEFMKLHWLKNSCRAAGHLGMILRFETKATHPKSTISMN